ncbi:MAG: hypothetical protein JW993_17660 [Sedimentisphaerales bacterium]|nr:hypothetical protein [Sedimentisphaerales bacterium]
MDGDPQKLRKRLSRRATGLIALVGLLLAVLLFLYVLWERRSPERHLAQLRAAGHPTSLAEWAKLHRLPEDAVDAADLYEKAVGLLRDPDAPNLARLLSSALSDRGSAWPLARIEAVSAWLAHNQECLTLLHEAAGIEGCWYEWADDYGSFPNLRWPRDCTRLLEWEMLYHAQQGDTYSAVRSFASMSRLSDSFYGAPTLLLHLVRMSCLSTSLVGLEWTLNAVPLADEQLRQLDDMLVRTSAALDFTAVLVSERCAIIDMYRDPALLSSLVGSGWVVKFPGTVRIGLLDTLDYMVEAIEASKLPPAQRISKLRAIGAKQQELPFWHFLSKDTAPALRRVAELDLRLQAHIELARTALAIERYRLATGDVPERLEDLVPGYLDAVPLDPFDGQPLRYRRTRPGYRLHSIMEDGQDNGGLGRDEVPKGDPHDLCFIQVR